MRVSNNEAHYLVSILNAILEMDGEDVSETGFGYTMDGEISSLSEVSMADALADVWGILCRRLRR